MIQLYNLGRGFSLEPVRREHEVDWFVVSTTGRQGLLRDVLQTGALVDGVYCHPLPSFQLTVLRDRVNKLVAAGVLDRSTLQAPVGTIYEHRGNVWYVDSDFRSVALTGADVRMKGGSDVGRVEAVLPGGMLIVSWIELEADTTEHHSALILA